jgi:prolyl-tRNA editing enzyme YbaK/EbsC (Cys-tRNA(Pro) deacylase)
LLKGLNVCGEVRELPAPVPTAADAAAQLGWEIGAIANSLVFTADGEPLLVLASGAHRVNVKRLAKYLPRATGQHVGGVAPVGHSRPITTLIDETLLNYEVVWAGASTESAMFATSVDELARITGGKVIAVA